METKNFNYMLSYKKTYEQLIAHTQEIINLYEDLIDETFEYYNSFEEDKKPINILGDIELLVNKKELHNKEKDFLNKHIKYYSETIQKICFHEFIEDDIDITPDKSQKITYCIKCEYTKSK